MSETENSNGIMHGCEWFVGADSFNANVCITRAPRSVFFLVVDVSQCKMNSFKAHLVYTVPYGRSIGTIFRVVCQETTYLLVFPFDKNDNWIAFNATQCLCVCVRVFFLILILCIVNISGSL